MYNQAQLIAEFVTSYIAGHKLRTFEEVFVTEKQEEEETVNNALVKILFMDYAKNWNRRRGEQPCQK